MINAPCEGLTFIALASIFSSFFGGKDFWLANYVGVQNNQILLLLPLIAFVGNMKSNCGNILTRATFKELIKKQLFMILLAFGTGFCHLSGRADTFAFMYVFVLVYSKTTIICQLCHAGDMEYSPFRLIPTLQLALLWFSGAWLWMGHNISIWLLCLFTLMSILDFGAFVYSFVTRTADLLGIYIFSVYKRPKNQ